MDLPLDRNNQKPVIYFNLCDPTATALKLELSSPNTTPHMVPYVQWSQLLQADSFTHPHLVYEVLREQFTAVCDNAWLGSMYGPLLPRTTYDIGRRVLELFKTKTTFGLIKLLGARYSFSLQNDPMSEQLIELNLHTKIHNDWGTFSRELDPTLQTQEVSYRIQREVDLPTAGLDNTHQWSRPIQVFQASSANRQTDTSASAVAASTTLSLAESYPMSRYNENTLSIRLNRPQRDRRRQAPYQGNQSGWGNGSNTNRNNNNSWPANNNSTWGSANPTANVNDESGVETAAEQRRTSNNRRVPREYNPPPLTYDEIMRIVAGGANPGLRPSDEMVEILPPNIVTTEGHISTYCIMRMDQLQMTINRLTRDTCWAHQRMSDVGIPRRHYQSNGGTRPVTNGPPMGDDVPNWSSRNQNTFNRRQITAVGRVPGDSIPGDSSHRSISETTEQQERRVF